MASAKNDAQILFIVQVLYQRVSDKMVFRVLVKDTVPLLFRFLLLKSLKKRSRVLLVR